MIKRLLLCVACFAVFNASAVKPLMLRNVDEEKMTAWVDSVYNAMSPEQRVGQLIAKPFESKNLSQSKAEIKRIIDNYHVGWVYFQGGPINNHVTLGEYARSISKVPIAVAIDGEWGLSMRMPDTPRFPKNMMLGAIQDDKLIYEYGLEMARECHEVGINVNFAPDADVNSNPLNPVIGTRSFGEDPLNVARKVVAYARGLEDGGVMAVAKHYPGHGDTHSDSHKTLPTVSRSLASIRSIDLLPFENFINAGLGGVMVGHLEVPALNTGKHPTSQTKRVVTDLLKNEMMFEGLVFTDGLGMKGAHPDGKPNGLSSFLAGSDVLLEPYLLDKSYHQLLDYYHHSKKNQAAIEAACKRILAWKFALGVHNHQPVAAEGAMARVYTREAKVVLRKLYAASMTVIKNDNQTLPIKHLEDATAVAVAGGTLDGADSFISTCELYTRISPKAVNAENATAWAVANKDASSVIIGVFDKKATTVSAVKQVIDKVGASKVVLVMFIKPYDLAAYASLIARCGAVVEAYEKHIYAQEYAAQVVFGGSDATGRMPVSVDGVAKVGDGITIMSSRLGYEMPEEQGLDYRLVQQIDSISNLGVKEGAFPGCQVLVARHGKVVINKCYGTLDAAGKEKTSVSDLYDLASVSKATGTLSGVMAAVDAGLLDVNGLLGTYIPQLKDSPKGVLSIRNLLFHETGMKPSLNMYTIMTDTASFSGALSIGSRKSGYSRFSGGAYINDDAKVRTDITSPVTKRGCNVKIGKSLFVGKAASDTIMQTIYNLPLRADRKFVYSCLNFCLLRQAEENVTGMRHDRYVYDRVFHRIGAYRTVYRPLDFFSPSEIAPTEVDDYFRSGTIRGVVHDETAAFSGGIQGNAGLFSNANDLAKLCQTWLFGGMYGGEQIFSEQTVKLFLTEKSAVSHRGLGFDKPNFLNPDNSSISTRVSAEVVGHTGFTGTSFWIDPSEDIIYIFLSNRVCPSRNNSAFARVGARYNIFSYIYDSIERNRH